MATAGRVPDRGSMTLESVPRLGRGCRLADDAEGKILLIPEGVLRLQGPGPYILERCDGVRTVNEIVADLEKLFPGTADGVIATETVSFLEALVDRRVVVE
jgi:pyrroloquinoline quinone biosynthesis protein D